MINDTAIQERLRSRFQNVEEVAEGVYRSAESYRGRPLAVRYFDFTDHFLEPNFERYQEHLLAPSYFRDDVPGYLRWNHYLYFVTDRAKDAALKEIRIKLEADRSYARKIVLDQQEFENLVGGEEQTRQELDASATQSWTPELDAENLGFILDESIQIPEIVRMLSEGRTGNAIMPASIVGLTAAERAASKNFLATLNLKSYRQYPLKRQYAFGKVNLVSGSNGVGKTSLLEAIEFLYAGGHLRPCASPASVSSELFGKQYVLESTTDAATLRQRNLIWYAKRDKLKSTLVESFARFNYLDTDAAVRLSSDRDPKGIDNAVARLILGPEAETIRERLKRIRERIEAEFKAWDSAILSDGQRLKDAHSKLEFLRNLPQKSDEYFESLRAALADLMWREAMPEKTKVSIENLGRELQTANVAAELLAQDGLSPTDVSGEVDYNSQLQIDLESLKRLKQQASIPTEVLFPIEQRLAKAQRAAEAIGELGPYVESGYSALHSERQALAASLATRNDKMRRIQLRDVNLTGYGSATLAESILAADREMSRLRNAQEEAAREISAFEAVLKSSEASRQRLLQAALQLLEADPEHCPVCQTRFDSGELAKKIAEDLGSADPGATRLAEMRKQFDQSTHEISVIERQLAELRHLVEFLDGNEASTVAAALLAVSESAQHAHNETSQLEALKSHLQGLESGGLSISGITSLLHSIPIDGEPSIDELQSLKAHAATDVEQARIDLDKTRTNIAANRAQLAVLASRYGLDSEVSVDEILGKIRPVLAKEEAYKQAARVLIGLMHDPGNTQRLTLQLKAAADALASVSSALHGEMQAGSEISAALEQISHLDAMVKEHQIKKDRLNATLKPIKACSERFESDEVANRVIAENAAEIARVFNAIHAPNDFTVVLANDGIKIIRNSTKKTASIAEMSSGQRAAYALSLYLAMNARLSAGPPLLLLDDPIAHVDDLNVLSFLDHLRDLAMSGRRQIFFATANEKLAGLFRQKFRFMGEEDFRDIRLDRSS